ncbi:MAG: hypothetical protein U0075_23080 [Thermomicrobiales bacterium]
MSLTRRAAIGGIALSMLGRWATPAPQAQAQTRKAALVFHQQPFRDTTSPRDVARNIDYIESLPFDGITVVLSASAQLMQGQPIPYSDMYDNGLAPLTGVFKRMRHNFVLAYMDSPGDLFTDSAWATTVQNFRYLARAARAAGLKGIFFDNEAYNRQWTDYPEDYVNPQHTLQEYQQQAHLRGRQIMEAMVSEYPDITVLFFHGPYLSEPKTPLYVRMNQAGASFEHELHGPFFVGFLDGLGDRAKLIDGGEVYQYRTADDFRKSYDWRKVGMASPETNCSFISNNLRAIWANKVSIGFGQATYAAFGDPMSPDIMRSSLANALQQADDYVWVYTEEDTWMNPGGMPTKWQDAFRSATGSTSGGSGGSGGNVPPRRRRRKKGRKRGGRRHN